MQFRALEPGIEISGDSVGAMVDGFGSAFRASAMKYLVSHGVLRDDPAVPKFIDRLGWYSQEASLAAYEAMTTEVGWNVLFDIGRRIPENVRLPPGVRDLHDAVRALDIGYHQNHRKRGLVMFNAVTMTMAEGIGHYGYARAGDRKIISVCDNPYPCDFDFGLLTTLARMFEPRARVTHDDDAPCRKRGEESCTYVITW